jgi:hypothetical protein
MGYRVCALILSCLWAHTLHAQADPDIDRIPSAAQQQSTDAVSANQNIYLQGDLTLTDLRNDLVVPLPPPMTPQWEVRSFADMRLNWQLFDGLNLAYSGRVNFLVEDDVAFPSRENVRNDLRETYLAFAIGDGSFLEMGRVNLKSGVAEGFNPTDYFKTRAVVEPTSIDPSALREDRLGVVMLEAQALWRVASFSFALAPKLAADSPPYEFNDLPSFNPMLDRTNAQVRALIKSTLDLHSGISPEFLVYEEGGQTQLGLNLSEGLGRAVVAYAEWSGGRRVSLVDEALEDARRTISPTAESPIPASSTRFFSNDLAIGASYATKVGITFDTEYDYHQAGFSRADWRNWFGYSAGADTLQSGELWLIRSYAGEQQEPIAQSSLFLRASWEHAWVVNLDLAGFIDIDLHDGSYLAQFAANWHISPHWTLGALVDAFYGERRSDFGSLMKVTRYF